MPSPTFSRQKMLERCVRYVDLRPCTTAFIDTRTPGSEEKENFTIIGPGVAENPDQHVHIDIPHGFNIGAARQPPGCVNSQHSHETAEVFIVHAGRWAFTLGVDGRDGSVELAPGDTISIPVHVFRGFTNVGDASGFLFAVLGGNDPGRVTWAPYVFEQAKDHGLVLLSDGRLIDTTRNETIPAGATPMPPTMPDQAAQMRCMTTAELAECVVRERELEALEVFPFGDPNGVGEAPIIGAESAAEAIPAGKMSWPHGFHLRRLRIGPGSATPYYRRAEPEVLLMQAGRIEFDWADDRLEVAAGDVLTVPVDLPRRYRNPGDTDAIAYVVRGGDRPGGFLLDSVAQAVARPSTAKED